MFQPFVVVTRLVHKKESSSQLNSGLRTQCFKRVFIYNTYTISSMALGMKTVKAAVYMLLELFMY